MLLLFALLGVYLPAANKLSQKNDRMSDVDQSAYMAYSISLFEKRHSLPTDKSSKLHSTYPRRVLVTTDSNRMVIYPLIQSFFYNENLSFEGFFKTGKAVNIFISIASLGLIYLILCRFFEVFNTILIVYITALSVFLYKAPWFQVEIFYYFLAFCAFLTMWMSLKRGGVKWGIISGAITAITHLTKASVIPLYALFCLFLIIKVFLSQNYKRSKYLTCILASLISFIIILLPHLYENKKEYGKYIYNVNTNYIIWFDSWESGDSYLQKHGLIYGGQNVINKDVSRLKVYLEEHSIIQIRNRFYHGLIIIYKNALSSDYGFFKYCLIYAIAAILTGILQTRSKNISLSGMCTFLFVAVFLLAYLLLFAFYTMIVDTLIDRFYLMLFLPFIFSCNYFVYSYKEITYKIGCHKISYYKLLMLIIAAMIVYDFLKLVKFLM